MTALGHSPWGPQLRLRSGAVGRTSSSDQQVDVLPEAPSFARCTVSSSARLEALRPLEGLGLGLGFGEKVLQTVSSADLQAKAPMRRPPGARKAAADADDLGLGRRSPLEDSLREPFDPRDLIELGGILL